MKIIVITPTSHLPGVNKLLETKGEVYYFEESSKEKIKSTLIKEAIDVIICNPNKQNFLIDKDLLEDSKVSIINTCSTGLNHIDINYCNSRKIKILSLTKDFELIENLPSTAELAFGLMLSLLRKINPGHDHASNYGWNYLPFLGRQVKDLNIGIVGYGRLGKLMNHYCRSFGANTLIYDPYKDESNVDSLEILFESCDVISLHVHVNKETKYMINKEIIKKSKNSPYLINTSRGEIVNELDVIFGLENNFLSGYGTDVVENEFDDLKKSPIINGIQKNLNILVTPHVGGMTIEGQTKAYTWAINKL